MSKQIRLAIIALIGISLSFTCLSQPSASSTSRAAQQSPATANATRNAALVAATQEVLKETSEVRQLSILRSVRSSAQSRAQIESMIKKSLDKEMTPARIHTAEVTLKKLGLVPPDFQYRALLIRLLTEQVAGYYEPKTGEFHLADWIDIDGQRPIMAHELTHALQDQHFNLKRFENWPKGDSDAELAARALIEGDASLAMAHYVASSPLRVLAFLKSLGTNNMSSVEIEKAPRVIRESLLFPYQEGIAWATIVHQRGGWNGVSKAFTELPQSTEQILHPEKYFAHEAPVKVTLPDFTPQLNGRGQKSEVGGQKSEVSRSAGSAAPGSAGILPALTAQREQFWSETTRRPFDLKLTQTPGAAATWKRLDYDTQGEWGYYLILDQFLKSPAVSRRAAAGWAGDRYAVYEGPRGEVLLTSLSTWDTENDAREFFDAYVTRTELRYPGATPVNTPPQLVTRKRWQTSEGIVTINLRGSRVLILEGVPDQLGFSAFQDLIR